MEPFGWAGFVALLTSIGFGALSAVFPLANAEAYVIASQVSAASGVIPVALGVGLGQTIGKLTLFVGVRTGKRSRLFHRQRARVAGRTVGATRQRLRRTTRRLLVLVGTKRWGLPIVFLAAVLGVPPLYAVALLAGATKMKLVWFALVVLVGRLGRFVLVALGFHGVHF